MEPRPRRWLPVLVLTVAVLGLILTESILASRGMVEITSPEHGQLLSGAVEIRGTAADDNLAYYQLEYSSRGGQWAPIGPAHRSQVVRDGVLGVWDTGKVAPGQYQLRLDMADRMGNRIQNTIQVTVAAGQR